MVHCMSKTLLQICVCLVLVKVACAAKAGEAYLSPLAVVADKQGKNLYVAEATAKQVAVFDITSEKVVKVIPLPDQPSGLALAPDGSSLYVTGVSPKGRVYVVNTCLMIRRGEPYPILNRSRQNTATPFRSAMLVASVSTITSSGVRLWNMNAFRCPPVSARYIVFVVALDA